jgi:hypothetical protein
MDTARFIWLGSALTAFFILVSSSGALSADFNGLILSGRENLDAGDYYTAESYFREALSLQPDGTEALLFLGITLSYIRPEQAFDILNRALRLDPENPTINLELGKLYVMRGVPSEAMDYLEAVKFLSPDSDEALRADEIIKELQTEITERPWKLNLSAGGQYDTNVLLLADDAELPQGTRDKDDYRSVLSVKGNYNISRTPGAHTSAGYELYQSLHQNLTDYDITSHTLLLKIAYLIRSCTFDFGYRYNSSTLGGDDFSSTHSLNPSLIIPREKDSFSILTYRWLNTDAKDGDLFPLNSTKTGNNYLFGLIHELPIGPHTKLRAGLSYDTSMTEEDYRDYVGYKGFLHLTFSLPYKLTTTIYGEYYKRDFGGPEPQRQEKKYTGSVSLKAEMNRWLEIAFNYTNIGNNAEPEIYHYNRSLYGLFLTVRL